MKSYVNLWQYLAEIFLEQNFQKKFETRLGFNNFFPKILENCCRSRQATDDNTIRRMPFACWVPKATNTPSEYVILISFPWQQWLCERASMLRLYIRCLSCWTYIIYDPPITYSLILPLIIFAEIQKLWTFLCEVLSPNFNCYCIDIVCFTLRSEA
jgi:hypothetical protein